MQTFFTLTEAYLTLLSQVYTNPEYDHDVTGIVGAGQGKKVNICPVWEQTNVQFRILYPSLEEDLPDTCCPARNALMKRYKDRETILFDDGDDNSTGEMGKMSKVWDRIKNPDGTINSNYGLMVYHMHDAGNAHHEPENKCTNQWAWAKSRLTKYKNSAQAIMHFNRPSHQWEHNLDQPCTVFVQFLIREDRLHFTSYMRSNDVVYGTPYNLSYFIKLMYRMVDELKPVYPKLRVGHLTHNATSFHIYKKHEKLVKSMLGQAPDQSMLGQVSDRSAAESFVTKTSLSNLSGL